MNLETLTTIPSIDTQAIVNMLLAFVLGVVGLSAFVAGCIGGFFAFGMWKKSRARHSKAIDSTLLEISLPRDNEIKIDAAEQMFSSFISLSKVKGWFAWMKVPQSISFEIVAKQGDIRFYIGVPKKLQDMVEKQIHGSYPDAHIREVEEYDLFDHGEKVSFAGLALDKEPFKPIKTFKELAVDPLSTIASTLGKMQEGEAAVIQLIITPADKSWASAGRSFISGVKKAEANPDTAKYSIDQKELEAIEQKITKPGFSTVMRIVVVSSTKEAADAHLSNIEGAFTQFSSYNSFSKAKVSFFKGNFMVDFIYRQLPLRGHGFVLTTEELATIFHFPNKSVENPNIYWLAAKTAPAPANIPSEGLYLGKSFYRGIIKPVHISLDDRRRHMYIIGKTGVGKTEFLKEMIMQDIQNGQGVAVIDPHGDLIEDILQLLPPNRAEDVVLFDPSDTERPMGLNMLEASSEEQKHLVVTSIIGLMYKLFDPNQTGIIGPRFEHAVRNAMLTVMVEPGNTLVEVMRALTDQAFVQELLPKVQDPIIRRYWTDQIAQTSDFHKSEVLDYITSKFGRFVTNTMMRNIIGQSESGFNFRQVMDQQKILLVNLAKGKIGEENSNFLGLILVPRILVAAMSRQDMAQADRKDFFLYVDEFQNFATKDFAIILSEARKYRLNLIVANQFIGQMDEEIKNAIFGNVGTVASFRVGVNDASYLQHEFQPTFSESDLINIEKYHAYMKTLIGGEPTQPFSLDLSKNVEEEDAKKNPKVAELVRELSRLKFAKPKEVVEQEIAKRSRLFEFLGDAGPAALPGKEGGGFGGGNM